MFKSPALLLLGIWTAEKTYPFLPVIDRHKYWKALRPVLSSPGVSVEDLFLHFAVWFAVFVLVDRLRITKAPLFQLILFTSFIICAQIAVIDNTVSRGELEGILLACATALVLPRRLILPTSLFLVFGYITYMRLEPFHIRAEPVTFGWIPFASVLHGSQSINTQSMFEKGFLYGTAIWILRELGMRRLISTGIAASALLVLSFIALHMGNHSAEITDSVIALIMGLLLSMSSREQAKARSGRAISWSP